MNIIAISGKRESGKTTAAEHIVATNEAVRLSFAGALREELVAIGYPPALIHNKPTPQPVRDLLVAHGRCRRYVDENYWVSKLWKAMGAAKRTGVPMVVIDDLRFWNEAEQLRSSKATLIRLNLIDPLYRKQFIPGVDDDKSETDLDNWTDWDHELAFRKGDIEGLRGAVEDIVTSLAQEAQ